MFGGANCMLALYALFAACKKPKGMLFKLADDDKFIGHAAGSKELTLVSYDKASRFNLEDLENQAEKKLVTDDKKEMFAQHGWWIFRKWFEMDSYEEGNKQGFNIVYSAPNVYILMRDGSCLSADSGIFRKVDCTSKEVNKFKMCKNKRCKDEDSGRMSKKINFMMCAIKHSMNSDYDLSLRSNREKSRSNMPNARSSDDSSNYQDSRARRHRQKHKHERSSEGLSSEWNENAFSNVLGLRPMRKHPRKYRKYVDSDSMASSSDDDSDSSGFQSGDCRAFHEILYNKRRSRYNRGNANC